MKKVFLILFCQLCVISNLRADDNLLARPMRVPSIEIRNLSQFKGKYISVYYALGKRSALGLGSQEERLEISKLKSGKVADYEIKEDSLLLPERFIKREPDGFNLAYNLVVFVIHNSPQFSWLNIDSNLKLSYPIGETASANHDTFAVNFLTKSNIDRMLADNSGKEPLIYLFGNIISADP